MPRVGEAQLLAGRGATAMIDVSDGLAIDLSAPVRGQRRRGAPRSPGPGPGASGRDPRRTRSAAARTTSWWRRCRRRRSPTRRPSSLATFGTPLTQIGSVTDDGPRRHGPGRPRARARAGRMGSLRVSAAATTRAGADDRGQRLGRRRRDPGRPQDLQRARGVRHDRDHRRHGAGHARRPAGRDDGARRSSRSRSPVVAADIGVDAAKTGHARDRGDRRGGRARPSRRPGSASSSSIPSSSRSTAIRCWRRTRSMRCDLAVLPLATLVTPNLPEAAAPGGHRGPFAESTCDVRPTPSSTSAPGAVLVKGGHLDGREPAADLFVDAGREEWLVAGRIDDPEHARDRLHPVRGDRGAPREGGDAPGRRRWPGRSS